MNDEYRIALFGPKNAGKTVYLTTLYSHGGNADESTSAHVMASDDSSDSTHNYLTNSYQCLCNGEWPDGTAFEQLRAIRFTITSEGVQSRVNIPDVAGEVTGRGRKVESWTQAEHDLKTQILSEFSTFDGFLIFAPADDTVEGKYLEFKWEMDALLQALKERAAADGIVRRPIAVVLSKWDVAANNACSRDEECTHATEFFRSTYSETAVALTETCENWKVFPVSSTGPTNNGRPPAKLHPRGMAAPVLWLLRTSDKSSLCRADEYSRRHANELFKNVDGRSGATFAQKAIERYQTILAKTPPQTIQMRARSAIDQLNMQIWKRRRKQWTVCTVILVTAVMCILTCVDYAGYRSAVQALRNAPQTPQDLDPAIEGARAFVDSAWHVPAGPAGWKQELLDLAKEKESQWESDWAARIREVDFKYNIDTAKDVQAKCLAFAERFPSSSFRNTVVETGRKAKEFIATTRGDIEALRLLALDKETLDLEQLERWVKDAKQFLEDEQFSLATARNDVLSASVRRETELVDRRSDMQWREFDQEYSQLADRPWDQYLAAKAWLAKNPESSHSGEVVAKIETALAAADDKSWNEVQEYKEGHRTDFRKIVEKSNDYLTKTEFQRHRAEADSFRTEQFLGWDEQMYRDITAEAVGKEQTGGQLRKIDLRCKAYVEKSERPAAMRAEVENWIAWYDKLQNGMTVSVELESVLVSKGSKWDDGFFAPYSPDVFVTVQIGSRSSRSGTKELDLGVETVGFPKSQLGTFPWKLGQRDLSVFITCEDYSDETLTAKLVEDEFMLRHLNNTVKFDDGKILVRLKCGEATSPPFPSYQGVK